MRVATNNVCLLLANITDIWIDVLDVAMVDLAANFHDRNTIEFTGKTWENLTPNNEGENKGSSTFKIRKNICNKHDLSGDDNFVS